MGCGTCKTENVLPRLVEWIRQRGMPKRISSNQDPHYTSYSFSRWCIERAVAPIVAAPDLHKSVGLVERINQTLLGRLRRMCYDRRQEDWALLIPEAIRLMNETPHSVTEYVPNELLIAGPREWNIARQRTQEHRDKINKRLGINRIFRKYRKGQKVWVWDYVRAKQFNRKLVPHWVGPAVLMEQLSQTIWRMRAPNGRSRLVHTDSLQPYVD